MATEIYLGNPPQYVIDWIKAHSKPAIGPKTKITFADGDVKEYDWSGEINDKTMTDAGLFDGSFPGWIKTPQTVEIGTNVTSIGNNAFLECNSMMSVTIHDNVTTIGNFAFLMCYSLGSITIPDGVTSIGSEAFSGCSGLTNVTIGNGVTSIGSNAFGSCSGLTSVTFSGKNKATVQGMENYSWALKSGCVIHCKDGDITI